MLKRSQDLRTGEGLSDHFHTSNNLGRITNILQVTRQKLKEILVKIRDHLEPTSHCHLSSTQERLY